MYHQFKDWLTPESVDFSINPKTTHKDMEVWPEDSISLLGLEQWRAFSVSTGSVGTRNSRIRNGRSCCVSASMPIRLGDCPSVGNVQNPITRGKMESYFLGETLSTYIFCFLMI